MRKVLIIVGVLLAVLVAAGAGGLFYVGMEAEKRFDAALERFSSPPTMALSKVSYTRGLFGAEAETALQLSAGPMSVAIPFKHTIRYMPLAQGLAEVQTELVVPANIKPMVDKVFGGASPLTGTTVLNFDGTEVTQFQSPAFSFKDAAGNFSWQGITGTVTMQGNHVTFNATAPGFKGDNPLFNASIQNLAFDGDMTLAADELWLGSSTLRLGKVAVTTPMAPAAQAEGLRIASETTEQGADMLRSKIALELRKLAVDGKEFSNMAFELEAGNLDRAVLVKLTKAMEKFQSGGADSADKAMESVTASLPQLLKRSPRIGIKRLNAVTPWGDFKSSVNVVFDGKGEMPSEPILWLTKVAVDAKLDASAAFMRWLVEEQLRGKVNMLAAMGEEPVAAEQAQHLAAELAAVRLGRLEQTGVLVPNGERYTAEFKIADGKFTLNGKGVEEMAALMD